MMNVTVFTLGEELGPVSPLYQSEALVSVFESDGAVTLVALRLPSPASSLPSEKRTSTLPHPQQSSFYGSPCSGQLSELSLPNGVDLSRRVGESSAMPRRIRFCWRYCYE